jgi:hypothetical protein
MTSVPITIINNFFDNPFSVKNWASTLEYNSSLSNQWPGERTKCLSEINYRFYSYVNRKVLSLFFEDYNSIDYKCTLYFQKLNKYNGTGWIHQDPNLYTFIIYLSDNNNLNCGTSLYKLKNNRYYRFENEQESFFDINEQQKHHKERNINEEILLKKQQADQFSYEKVLDIPDHFNKLIVFPSEQFHSANFLGDSSSSRMTLIGFVYNLTTSLLPSVRFKQVVMS